MKRKEMVPVNQEQKGNNTLRTPAGSAAAGRADRHGLQMVMFAAVFAAALVVPGAAVFASTNSVVTSSFDTLLSLVESIVSSIGTLITLWGISEFGISMQGAQGTMQAEAFKRIAGGLIMVLAPQILNIIT